MRRVKALSPSISFCYPGTLCDFLIGGLRNCYRMIMCTYYKLAVILSTLDTTCKAWYASCSRKGMNSVVVTTSRARLVHCWFWQLYVTSSNQYLRSKKIR